jgi:hypothetical protein
VQNAEFFKNAGFDGGELHFMALYFGAESGFFSKIRLSGMQFACFCRISTGWAAAEML